MNNKSSGGLNLFETVQVVFIILKLFNLIQLNWWQVFIPSYITAVIALIVILIIRRL